MHVRVGKDENDWIRLAWTWIHEEVAPGSRVFVPAGGTPEPLYRRWTAEPTKLLTSLRLVQIDEIISGPQKNYFQQFFIKELPTFQKQMEWIDRADQGADVAILGVGVNGHVAFHEPGLPRHFASGCVRLSAETLGYLKLSDPTWGLTYGVASFVKAKKILVLAKGPRKKQILERSLIEKNLPVSWVLDHPHVTLISDFSIDV